MTGQSEWAAPTLLQSFSFPNWSRSHLPLHFILLVSTSFTEFSKKTAQLKQSCKPFIYRNMQINISYLHCAVSSSQGWRSRNFFILELVFLSFPTTSQASPIVLIRFDLFWRRWEFFSHWVRHPKWSHGLRTDSWSMLWQFQKLFGCQLSKFLNMCNTILFRRCHKGHKWCANSRMYI